MNCPDCGAANPADARFCGDCGHQIEAAARPPKRKPPPPQPSQPFSWDSVFKWIGIGVVGLFVLGLLAGF